METKLCGKCRQILDTACFSLVKSGTAYKLRNYCKACDNAASRASYKKKVKEVKAPRAYTKTLGPKGSNAYKHAVNMGPVSKTYGLSEADFQALQNAQQGCCKICGADFGLLTRRCDIDHDHKTGKIRGALCPKCNVMIGRLETAPVPIDKVIQYLLKPAVRILKIKDSVPTHLVGTRSEIGLAHKANMITLKSRFGISEAQYQHIMNLQKGLCKLCEKDLGSLNTRSMVEHNHKTGEVRGLVCAHCNNVIAAYESEYYTSFINYLLQV